MDDKADAGVRRDLGLVDSVVVVAGGIIGVGIFANPSNVARVLDSPLLILAAWTIGGAVPVHRCLPAGCATSRGRWTTWATVPRLEAGGWRLEACPAGGTSTEAPVGVRPDSALYSASGFPPPAHA